MYLQKARRVQRLQLLRLNCTAFIRWIYRDVSLCCLILFTPSLFAPSNIQPRKINWLSGGNTGKLAFKES